MQSSNNDYGRVPEVDFFDIATVLWKEKRLIAVCTILTGLIGLAVALLTTPVYEVKYGIAPPTINDVAHLNYGRTRESELAPYSVKEVYDVFLRNLQSDSLRQSFFSSVYIKSQQSAEQKGIDKNLYENFYKRLKIAPAGKDLDNRWTVSLQESDPAKAAEMVSAYVAQAGEAAKQEVVSNAHTEAAVRARILTSQINTLRQSGKKQREDTIVRLREALNVAKSINLEKPLIFAVNQSAEMAGNLDGNLTYMRGSKALEAELVNLEARESDDPFIKELRGIEEKLAYYQGLEAAPDNVTVYRQDGVVSQSSSPVKPKKAIILIIGLIAGAGLGCTIALMRYFIRRRVARA